jgi:hypothetical protein
MLSVRFAITDEGVEFSINHFHGILRGGSRRKESANGMPRLAKRSAPRVALIVDATAIAPTMPTVAAQEWQLTLHPRAK